MAELTQSVSNEKVSTRWEETYVSRGINRQMSVIPPGLYEGGDVDYSTTTTLRIAAGKYVVQDTANGFGMILRDPDATEIDCSSLFPVATQKDWYVGLRITYTTGAATTCEFFMTDVLPLDQHFVGKDELVFCQVTLHVADTGLNQATITTLAGASPKPYPKRSASGSVLSTDRDLGLLDNVSAYGIPSSDEKDALGGYPSVTPPSISNKFLTQSLLNENYRVTGSSQSVTISGNIKFQLSGEIYVGTGDTSSSVHPFFRLSPDEYGTAPYMTSGAMVFVSNLRTSDDLSILIPSIHADGDGFYEDPWVYLTSSAGSLSNDSIYCFCMEKSTEMDAMTMFDSIPTIGRFMSGHAEDFYVKSAGTTGSEPYDRWLIADGTLQLALSTLITAVNQNQLDGRTLGSVYNRIFRSGTTNSDSSVSSSTTSIYIKQGIWIVVIGAYINGSGDIISPVAIGDVSVFGVGSSGVFWAFKNNVPSSTNLGSPDDIDGVLPSSWDSSYSGSELSSLHNFLGDIRIDGHAIVDDEISLSVGVGSLIDPFEISHPDNERTWMTMNAEYDKSGDQFVRRTTGDSIGMMMSPYRSGSNNGSIFAFGSKTGTESWSESGWNIQSGMWSTKSYPVSCIFSDGGDYDVPTYTSRPLIEIDGLLVIKSPSDNEMAVFVVDNQSQSTVLLYGNTGYWDNGGASSRISVYFSGANLVVYNNTGTARTLRIGCFDVNSRITVPGP